MLNLTRGNALLMAARAGAAFGLPKPLSFIEAALAQKGPEAGKGFRPFKLGKVQAVLAEATRRNSTVSCPTRRSLPVTTSRSPPSVRS
jgi:hypothetical protein